MIAAIAQAFPDIPVYDEHVEQGLSEPAFTVRSVRPVQSLFLGRRYQRDELIEVVYFPPEEGQRNTNDVMDVLQTVLEYIDVGSGELLRGTDMDAHIDDEDHVGVLTVNYNYFAYGGVPGGGTEPPMQTEIEQEGIDVR